MKRTKKHGRKYTKFGICLNAFLYMVQAISFIAMLYCARISDMGHDVPVIGLILSTAVFGASMLLHNKIFE